MISARNCSFWTERGSPKAGQVARISQEKVLPSAHALPPLLPQEGQEIRASPFTPHPPKTKKFIVASATGLSPALFSQEIFYFFLLFLYSVSKKAGRMAEQLEKLQVDIEELEKQTKKKWMKWENQGPSTFF